MTYLACTVAIQKIAREYTTFDNFLLPGSHTFRIKGLGAEASHNRAVIDDINNLIPHKANLRLCKGIYNEKRVVAYKDKAIINDNYSYGLEKLLRNGCYIGIATHDEKLVWQGLKLIDELKLKREQYEFQMLLGVDHELRRIIVNSGHRLRVYVPFGTEWFAYSTRRLKENPAMAGHIMQNTFQRIFGIRQ